MAAARTILVFIGALVFLSAGIIARAQSSDEVIVAPSALDTFLAWESTKKILDTTNGQEAATFSFTFTNISTEPVTILGGHGSCSCTTVDLPMAPWKISPGGVGRFQATVSLAGKAGLLFKTVSISSDKGDKSLMLQVNMPPPPPPRAMTQQDRARGIAAAKIDRQAVFKGDCAGCHARNLENKFGPELFALACAICHEAQPRALMVPDLHHLKGPTSEEFWRTWITVGKPGTLMPAFATAQGGPLTDMQIASLATYLNATIPSPSAQTNEAK